MLRQFTTGSPVANDNRRFAREGRISGLGERLLSLMQAIVLGYSGFVVIPPANELRATSENPLKWVKRIVNRVPSLLAGDGVQPISMGFLC